MLFLAPISVLSLNVILQSRPVANPTIFVERTETGQSPSQVTQSQVNTPRHPPKARPIFAKTCAKKRKVSEEILGSQASRVQKRTRSDGFSHSSHSQIAAPVEDIRQALRAQREPQLSAINDLRMCSLIAEFQLLDCYQFIQCHILSYFGCVPPNR